MEGSDVGQKGNMAGKSYANIVASSTIDDRAKHKIELPRLNHRSGPGSNLEYFAPKIP
ncbi:hypothetical protein U1Q18_012237, partial [Sarracenia purpurea var. burkii]